MFGLLGKTLTHSFSKQIHEYFGGSYDLFEVDDLDHFIHNTRFSGLNVTIPYKQEIIQYCDVIDPLVSRTNSCNTIVKKDDLLYAYNTDYDGFLSSIKTYDIQVKGRTVAIIGNGATSRTVKAVVEDLGARDILVFARTPKGKEYPLADISEKQDIEILINTTPVGMHPNIAQKFDFSLDVFTKLQSVLDVVYNPLRTHLLLTAKEQDIQVMNGLYMLISQAARSYQLFHQIDLPDTKIQSLYRALMKKHTNIVFIGMPKSGKSLYSKIYSEKHHMSLYDIDKLFEEEENMSIKAYFDQFNEQAFREKEQLLVKQVSSKQGVVISTGGGVVLSRENVRSLKQNGLLLFIDTPLPLLQTTTTSGDRPLLKNGSDLENLYLARYQSYIDAADIILKKETLHTSTNINTMEVLIYEYFGT